MLDYSKLAFPKPTPKVKKAKWIKKISDKRKERLSWFSEKDLFKEIWEERERKCIKCWKALKEAKAHNFNHIKSKGKYPELRLCKDNIEILCFACHFEFTTWLKYKWIELD